jgi:hypothetical protein
MLPDSVVPWLQLGDLLADGFICPDPLCPEEWFRAHWAVDRPLESVPEFWQWTRLEDLPEALEACGTHLGILCPELSTDQLRLLLPFCSQEEYPIWLRLEAGLQRLLPKAPEPFVPTPLQKKILEALDGRALRSEPLANEIKTDKRKLYRQGKNLGPLDELEKYGLVTKHRRLGYYRPDRPPPGLVPGPPPANSKRA